MNNSVLSLNDVTMQFGGVVALDNLCLCLRQGEIVGLIGPNGAGKTTAFNCITGVYEPSNGEIIVNGETVISNYPRANSKTPYLGKNGDKYNQYLSKRPDEIAALGISRTFQNIRLFKGMTVFENVLVGMHLKTQSSFLSATFRTGKSRAEEQSMQERAKDLLSKLDLYEHRNDMATSLPYGKQRHLEIARALATEPTILLLDEPAAGMNPSESEDLMKFVSRIRDEFNLSILMIEHHMQVIMGICDHIYVLNYGGQIADGTPSEIKSNKAVIDAYLGVEQ